MDVKKRKLACSGSGITEEHVDFVVHFKFSGDENMMSTDTKDMHGLPE